MSVSLVGLGGGSYPNYSGGGITCRNSSSPSLQNVAISDNISTDKGGGIFCHHSSPTITHNTISNNSASVHGGGISFASLS